MESFRVQEPLPHLAGTPASGTVPVAAPAGAAPTGTRRRLPRLDRREIAAIFAGGALGTLLRAALAEAFPRPPTAWPWPTFAVNIVAAFLVGYFVTGAVILGVISLSEDLPLIAVAVDTRSRIETVLPQTIRLNSTGAGTPCFRPSSTISPLG
jgi:CrcB-like protein, Camphor Resistance (CrcB)